MKCQYYPDKNKNDQGRGRHAPEQPRVISSSTIRGVLDLTERLIDFDRLQLDLNRAQIHRFIATLIARLGN
jgi:hypothetical protein